MPRITDLKDIAHEKYRRAASCVTTTHEMLRKRPGPAE